MKNYNKWFLTPTLRAIKDFNLINPEDKVAVGLSGGKDSITLLYILNYLSKYSHLKFQLIAIHLHMGWDYKIDELLYFCQANNIELYEEKTNIGEIIFSPNNKYNPCALCSHLRRGALYKKAQELHCNKVALGHHADDAIETFLMNLLNNGNLSTFQPKINLNNTKLKVIRPLIYLKEHSIQSVAKKLDLPVSPSPCPRDGCTSRQKMKNLITSLEKDFPQVHSRFISAFKTINHPNFW